MAQYYVAERKAVGFILGDVLGRFDACDHRHKTVSGAKKCAAHHNAVARGEGDLPRVWSVGARVSRGGNKPERIQPPTVSPVPDNA